IAGRSQAPEKVLEVVRLGEEARGDDILRSIYKELDDTWAWVSSGPEMQQVAATGAPKVAKGAPDVEEGDQAVLAPVQAPQPPAARPARTMVQRLGFTIRRILVYGYGDLAGKEIDEVGEVSIIWNHMCVVVMLESRRIYHTHSCS
ncbi:hypothetical protein Tco_1479235, partial [Tanacetum coccineum]